MTSSTNSHKLDIIWPNVIALFLYHCMALHGFYYLLTGTSKWQTFALNFIVAEIAVQGLTSGAHRLWSHRSYKAKFPLRVFLCLLQTIHFQKSIFEWSRDHRVHHKHTDTNADPHSASRGLFFSHMGWLMVRKHPDVIKFGKTIDVSDLETDPVVRFQKKYFFFLASVCCFLVPTLIPWYYWNEDLYTSLAVGMARYVFSLHRTFLVNSAAHKWGMKPYDRNIWASENAIISIATHGEGSHNYHHVFPQDYRDAEFDTYRNNISLAFIDFMAKIGLAYDLKTASKAMIKRRKERTGDL